jgi:hypothetical protein
MMPSTPNIPLKASIVAGALERRGRVELAAAFWNRAGDIATDDTPRKVSMVLGILFMLLSLLIYSSAAMWKIK